MPQDGEIFNQFHYNGKDLDVTDEMKKAFDMDGFVVVKNLLSQEEVDIVQEAVTGPGSLTTYAAAIDDGQGKAVPICHWRHAGHDTTGNLARTRKMAGTAEQLLRGEVYHYHGKIIMKNAGLGGSFVWHQDYGYWYNYGCLFPDMMTVFVALDRCGRDNGCLQVLRGSHRCGRIDHIRETGGQDRTRWNEEVAEVRVEVDPRRVSELEKRLDKVYVELSRGDAIFFHCNLVHASSSNDSPFRRWAFLSCYNRKSNNPTKKVHAMYNPLEMLDNQAVVKLGVSRDLRGKEVMVKKDDGKFSYFET